MDDSIKNRILIVDDEKSNLLYLNSLLGPEHTLYMARNGAEAISRAREYSPDLILLDIIMPDMDGYEVLSELKKHEITRDIPVIFITGLSGSEEETKGLGMGADDYIAKPFNEAIVKLRVKNQLKIVNQMRILDRQLKQQLLVTSVSQKFLTDVYAGSLFTGILGMIGEFMDIARILLYEATVGSGAMICLSEWINPKSSLETKAGCELALPESTRSALHDLAAGEKDLWAEHGCDIMTPIFNKGKMQALLYFSKECDGRDWSESEIQLAILVSSIFSVAFERDAMAQLIIQKELAEKSSRAKSEFLSRMSHEMRTPMNAILGMTNLARNTTDPARRNEYLEKSAAAARNLLLLIEDVLDIADLSDGKFKLGCDDIRFQAMLQSILKQSNHMFESKRQTLSADIDPAIPETLIGDEMRLVQVIDKLLSNACKFTPEHGSINVKARVIGSENNRADIQVDITDDGIGIPADMLDMIFAPFEQADGGIDRKYGGTGLGLPLAKSIVEMMSGTIGVKSEPGAGSTFSFTFPAQIKPSVAEEPTDISFAGVTALLADDIEVNRELLMAILEDTGIEFVCAANGLEAVGTFSADPKKFDIILMDINMPEMDGVEATRRIRSLGAQIPIIAVTANTSAEDVKVYHDAGMTDHIGKPEDFDEVLRKISFYLKRIPK